MSLREKKPVSLAPKNASFGTTAKAVLCAFIGIRKRGNPACDAVCLKPVHVIVAGLIGVTIFIAILIGIVKAVVSS